ncbi:hypothetical protein hamaS1_30630 [Moorella sp. Hama-1]|nr:hypothetical protein hamaS1_30630 [Moorella sp. Hama-1]
MRIYDYKGGPCIQFRRPKENEKDNEIKFIDDIIEREYLNVATTVINNYFYGFFEGYGDNLYDEVERIQPYIRLKYGYKNGKFFSKELPSE